MNASTQAKVPQPIKASRGAKIFQSGDIDGCPSGTRFALSSTALPNIEQWMVDTLWMCNLADAIEAKSEVRSSSNLRFFECPLQPEDLAGHQDALHPIKRLAHRLGRTHPDHATKSTDWLNP